MASRRWLLLGLGVAILLPRLYLAVTDVGMIWSDEIFQTLEQGHRLAFGYGLVPWEFRLGARSWLLPGVLGGAMRVLAWLGVGSGAGLTVACKVLFAGLAVAGLYPMLRAAAAFGGGRALLLCGLGACAFPAHLLYGSRALAEVASTPFLTFAVWLLLPWGLAGRMVRPFHARGGRVFLAGVLLGLSTLLRYQNAVLVPAIVVIVVMRAGLRPGLWVAAGVALLLLGGGLLDWLTWGRPFQSFVVYLRFNLVEGGANQWGIAKRGFYLRTMWSCNGPAVLLLAVGFVASLRRAWPIALLALLYLGALVEVPHKELRFLVPVLPLFLLCAAVGLGVLIERLPYPASRRRALTLAIGFSTVALFTLRAPAVTFADIGQTMETVAAGGPTSRLVWGAFGERNRLFVEAAKHADLCGLAVPAVNAYWTGGYTYLHRRVPLLWSAAPADLAAANYVLLMPGQRLSDPRYLPAAQAGPYALWRRDGACAPPPRASAAHGRLAPMGVPGT
jgi:phosphatidylinositol glycan class B